MYLQCWFGEAADLGQDVLISWESLKTIVYRSPNRVPTVECMILGDLNWHRCALLMDRIGPLEGIHCPYNTCPNTSIVIMLRFSDFATYAITS